MATKKLAAHSPFHTETFRSEISRNAAQRNVSLTGLGIPLALAHPQAASAH